VSKVSLEAKNVTSIVLVVAIEYQIFVFINLVKNDYEKVIVINEKKP